MMLSSFLQFFNLNIKSCKPRALLSKGGQCMVWERTLVRSESKFRMNRVEVGDMGNLRVVRRIPQHPF